MRGETCRSFSYETDAAMEAPPAGLLRTIHSKDAAALPLPIPLQLKIPHH